MKKIIILFLSTSFIFSCTGQKVVDIKSPCVSTKEGPCGPKKSINDWWLKKYQNPINS